MGRYFSKLCFIGTFTFISKKVLMLHIKLYTKSINTSVCYKSRYLSYPKIIPMWLTEAGHRVLDCERISSVELKFSDSSALEE